MVIANDAGVNGYTLDPNLGEFILTHPRMKIPNKGNQYSINEGNSIYWYKPIEEYIHHIKHPAKGKSTQSLRYIGSMVADFHRVILYGGSFLVFQILFQLIMINNSTPLIKKVNQVSCVCFMKLFQ